jgi:uncharacterized protein DUF6319
MGAAGSLTEEDLTAVRAELARERPVTVWFTAKAVGVPVGGSAKVVSVDDPPEGDFIQVRPAGSRDTMFCSPNELTRDRPARKRVAKTAPVAAPPKSTPKAAPVTSPVAPAVPAPVLEQAAPAAAAPGPVVTGVVAPVPEPAPRSTPTPAPAPTPAPTPAPASSPERARPAAGRVPSRSSAPPSGVTVTLTATPEGEWSVEVVVGKKRTVRPTPVVPGDVAKAARSLPDVVAEAIDSALDSARRRQQERVEQLRAELEAAQRALQDLSG